MKVTFYGTRGSIAVSGTEYTEFGGNTSCVLVTFDNGFIGILDAGTGIRSLGNDLIASDYKQDNTLIGFSHTHLDHIMGLLFFKPAYNPNNKFTLAIHGRNKQKMNLHDIFATQTKDEYFPVSIDKMGAQFDFWEPSVTKHTTPSGIQISGSQHNHPGNAFGYRISHNGKTLVYCTDIEHLNGIDSNVVKLSKDADLLIHDGQYTPEELKNKKGWGHSSWEQAVEVAEESGAKKLAIFHHDPEHTDEFLLKVEKNCQERFKNTFFAREGTTIGL